MSNDTREKRLCKWRIACGMYERHVWAEDPFSAAHACGLGSGDLMRASFEVAEGNDEYPTGTRGGFHGD